MFIFKVFTKFFLEVIVLFYRIHFLDFFLSNDLKISVKLFNKSLQNIKLVFPQFNHHIDIDSNLFVQSFPHIHFCV